ncbi:MAG: cation-translocating P-type ATPase [Candidatus Methanomethylophilus sp.]|nr:cation-translocating P-type ATPase [Methanomethylophilus sp.]
MKGVLAIDVLKDDLKRSELLCAVSVVALIASFLFDGRFTIDPAWVAVVLCGAPIIWKAFKGIVEQFDITADMLVALAVIASLGLGEYFAAGLVALIMALGGLLEEYSASRSRDGIAALTAQLPRTARRIREGREEEVVVSALTVGDTVRVSAGETIPTDGTVAVGRTAVDQAVVTGESLPVDKVPGDKVFSGSVNCMGAFDYRVDRPAAYSSMQQIAAMVSAAGTEKTHEVKLADKWASYLVVMVLGITGLVYLVTRDPSRAVAVMVVFCPCAFVLAVPTAVIAAVGNLSRHRVMVQDSNGLARLAAADRLAFDKTGTLTEGRPEVLAVEPATGVNGRELLSAAAAAESRSAHPLAKALTVYAAARQVELPTEIVCETIPGRGLSAVFNGRQILVGNRKLLEEHGIAVPAASVTAADRQINRGATVSFTVADGRYLGFIVFADRVRPESAKIIAGLRNDGFECILLTGDNQRAASRVAEEVGIRQVRAGCTPADKLTAIAEIQKEDHKVCMVGDGINDAPALKKAYVGVAMGRAGSGSAVGAADLVLVGDDLNCLAYARRLCRHMMKVIRGNIAFAICWNALGMGLAAFGVFGPVGGAIFHNIGSVAVVACSALILIWGREKAQNRTDIRGVSGNTAPQMPPESA